MAKVHAKRSALKASVRKARLRTALDFALMLAAAGAVIALLLYGTLRGGEIVLTAVGAALIVVLALRARANSRDAAVRRGGSRGEDAALSHLRAALPDSYTIFTNLTVTVGGRTSETDLLVVGPAGVTVVEVKNYSGLLTGGAQDKQLNHTNSRRADTPYNPLLQVATHARRVTDYLASAGGPRPRVRGMVYFVNPRLEVRLQGVSDVPCFTADQADALAAQLQSGRPALTPAQVRSIVETLDRA